MTALTNVITTVHNRMLAGAGPLKGDSKTPLCLFRITF